MTILLSILILLAILLVSIVLTVVAGGALFFMKYLDLIIIGLIVAAIVKRIKKGKS